MPAPASHLAAYTPAHLARRILQERRSIQGERRVVTVLFADAVGSTAYGERVDAEQVYAVVQRSVAMMMDAVHRYEGAITQFRGDGVMALFGAPLAHEDSARRAVLAALEMQRALAEDAAHVRARYGFDQQFRVGLHTGPVVVGTISDDLVMDYSAVGDTANLAARLEGMADPGAVFISEATWREVRDYIDCEPLGERGQGQDRGGARVPRRAPREVQSRIDAAAARGLSPFVGRAGELDQLRALFDERARRPRAGDPARPGRPASASPGFCASCGLALGDEAVWLEGRCTAIGQTSSYLPVIEVARRALGLSEGDDAAQVVARIDAPPGFGAAAPYLKFLLRADTGDEQVDRLDPLERQFGILDAIWELFRRQAREPAAGAGGRGSALGRRAIRARAGAPGAPDRRGARAADRHLATGVRAGAGRRQPAHARAGPLDERDSERIARAALDTDALPPELTARVLARAEGNPFFLEEVVRSLFEEGVLGREDGRVVLRRPLDSVRIPVTIQDVILARIDRLPRASREALQLASVIGREFTVGLLERISDLGASLRSTLAELEKLELVYGTKAEAEVAYMFNHALTHDVAYSTLLGDRRKALHRAVAAAITDLYADRLDERWGVLAHHHEAAEDWPQALDLPAARRRAGVRRLREQGRARSSMIARSASPIGWATRAGRGWRRGSGAAARRASCSATRRAPRPTSSGCDRRRSAPAIARSRARRCCTPGRCTSTAAAAASPRSCFAPPWRWPATTCPVLKGAINAMLGSVLLRAGPERQAEGDACLREATAVADQITRPDGPSLRGDHEHRPAWLAGTLRRRARRGRAVRVRRRPRGDGGVQDADALGPQPRARRPRSVPGGAGRAGAVLAVCERNGDALAMGRCLNTLGWIHGDLQDPERALALNRRCLQVTEERDPEVAGNAHLNAADALVALGRLQEADEEYERVESFVRTATGHDRRMIWRYGQHLYAGRGTLHLQRGDVARAATAAAACLDLAERSDSRKYIAAARRLGALVRQASGETTAAHAEIDAALALAREVANPPQLWTTLAAAAEIRAATGDQAGAEAARAERDAVIARVADDLDAAVGATFRASPLARGERRAIPAAR